MTITSLNATQNQEQCTVTVVVVGTETAPPAVTIVVDGKAYVATLVSSQ
jgi:hypothetical protein